LIVTEYVEEFTGDTEIGPEAVAPPDGTARKSEGSTPATGRLKVTW
jgi:hypothetical protein